MKHGLTIALLNLFAITFLSAGYAASEPTQESILAQIRIIPLDDSKKYTTLFAVIELDTLGSYETNQAMVVCKEKIDTYGYLMRYSLDENFHFIVGQYREGFGFTAILTGLLPKNLGSLSMYAHTPTPVEIRIYSNRDRESLKFYLEHMEKSAQEENRLLKKLDCKTE